MGNDKLDFKQVFQEYVHRHGSQHIVCGTDKLQDTSSMLINFIPLIIVLLLNNSPSWIYWQLLRDRNFFINVFLHLDCHLLSWSRKHWQILPDVQSVLSSLLLESCQWHSDELLWTHLVLKLKTKNKQEIYIYNWLTIWPFSVWNVLLKESDNNMLIYVYFSNLYSSIECVPH